MAVLSFSKLQQIFLQDKKALLNHSRCSCAHSLERCPQGEKNLLNNWSAICKRRMSYDDAKVCVIALRQSVFCKKIVALSMKR